MLTVDSSTFATAPFSMGENLTAYEDRADSIAGAVKEITDLPLLVIASHGHFDHIGGSWQFEKI